MHGNRVDEPWVQYNGAAVGQGQRVYLHRDHQNSIIALSNGFGTAVNTLRYDAYGLADSGNVGRFGYTGQTWLADLGLYHYKARMYSPRLGRFMQTDPIGYEDQMNLYAYVGNDPMNFTDPTGMVRDWVALGRQAIGLGEKGSNLVLLAFTNILIRTNKI